MPFRRRRLLLPSPALLSLIAFLAACIGGSVSEASLPWMEWRDPQAANNLDRFPSENAPGWIDVVFPSAHRGTGGSLGLVAWDEDGASPLKILHDPAPPLGRKPVWTEDPPEDGRSGPPGYCRFRAVEALDGELRVAVRVAVPGPERPLRIELAWSVLESVGRSDTLEGARGSIPSLSVLGGPAAIRRSPVVHALAPRALEPGRALEVLGAGVDRVRTFALLDARQTSWSLAPIGNPTEARARVRLPATMPAGSASVLIDDAKIAHGAVAVGGGIQGGDPPRGGVWDPADGDCLVVAADPLYDALESLTQDLLDRGFRPSRARLSSLLEAHAPASPEEAIRLAVADACAGFAAHPLALILVGTASEDLPERDLIPTAHVAYDHELPGYYDGTYADDGLFGDLPGSADLEPELLVGRIPARTPQELSQYVAKLLAYRSQAPRASVLLAVGDANINRDNGDRGRAAASLLETATRAGFLDGEIQRASAYMPLSEPANRQRALGDFLGFLSSGIGLLDLFGNNTGPADLVHMLEAPPGPSHPQITAGMMPTEGKLPIALLHTCLNGAFDEDMHFQGGDSPVEEWVRHPTRGVIAAIAQSHITTFFDDWELGERILERLERADGASLGALHAGARSLLLRQPRTARSAHSIRMANLLGDPLLSPALGIDQIRLDGSFDVAGSWPRQGCLSFERDWTTADLDLERAHARVAYGGVHLPLEGMGPEEPVYPIGGSRMLRVGGFHGLGRGRRAAAWTVFRCDLLVRRGSVLSYWARQEHDPQGRGRLAVDAVTETGRVLSVDLRDGGGLPADPGRYAYSLRKWHHFFVRLDPWAGERIREILVRYEAPGRGSGVPPPIEEAPEGRGIAGGGGPKNPLHDIPSIGGCFAGYIDEIRVDFDEAGAILDPEFARDRDRDGSADYWVAPWPGNGLPESSAGVPLHGDDGAELWIAPQGAAAAGMAQVLSSVEEGGGRLVLRFSVRSLSSGFLRLATVDPATGLSHDQESLGPIGQFWQEREVLLERPPTAPVLLELTATGGPLGIRDLREGDLVPCPASAAAAGAAFPDVRPNPTSGDLRVTWNPLARRRSQRLELFDVAGRLVARLRQGESEGPSGEASWALRDGAGRALPSGVYYLRLHSGRVSSVRTIQIVR